MSRIPVEHITSHHLDFNADMHLVDQNQRAFDSQGYSRMKWGVIDDTRTFAISLAETLIDQAPQLIDMQTPPGVVVVYQAIPHAATLLAQRTLEELNSRRTELNLPLGQIVKVYAEDYDNNYTSSQAVTRREIIKKQHAGMHLERDALKEYQPLVIDDLRVTGATVDSIIDFIIPYTAAPIIAGYIAIFTDRLANSFPELEAQLDSISINSIEDLTPYLVDEDVELTFRLFRELLLLDEENRRLIVSLMKDDLRDQVRDLLEG